MRRFGAFLLALAAWGWGAAALAEMVECGLLEDSPQNDLIAARKCYALGTDFLAQGEFLEAQNRFHAAAGIVAGRLRTWELEAEFLDLWKAQAEILEQALAHFETDWTNAVREVQAIREPLQSVFRSIRRNASDLPDMRIAVKQALEDLELMGKSVLEDNRSDARSLLSCLRSRIEKQIARGTFEGELRQLLADTERALAQLEECFPGGSEKKDLPATDKETEGWRSHCIKRTRIAIYMARQMLEQGNALRARGWLEDAEVFHLCKLGSDLDEATLAERDALIREIEELDTAAERMLEEEP